MYTKARQTKYGLLLVRPSMIVGRMNVKGRGIDRLVDVRPLCGYVFPQSWNDISDEDLDSLAEIAVEAIGLCPHCGGEVDPRTGGRRR